MRARKLKYTDKTVKPVKAAIKRQIGDLTVQVQGLQNQITDKQNELVDLQKAVAEQEKVIATAFDKLRESESKSVEKLNREKAAVLSMRESAMKEVAGERKNLEVLRDKVAEDTRKLRDGKTELRRVEESMEISCAKSRESISAEKESLAVSQKYYDAEKVRVAEMLGKLAEERQKLSDERKSFGLEKDVTESLWRSAEQLKSEVKADREVLQAEKDVFSVGAAKLYKKVEWAEKVDREYKDKKTDLDRRELNVVMGERAIEIKKNELAKKQKDLELISKNLK